MIEQVRPYGDHVIHPALRDALATSAADLDAEPDVLFQEPADGLVAASGRLDLLAMGSAEHGPAGAVALGGVTRRVTERASCPVLVLPHDTAGPIDALISNTGGAGHTATDDR